MRRVNTVSLIALAIGLSMVPEANSAILFNRDIRPIFSENCYACHGPDEAKRMTFLRLDTKDGAFVTLSGGRTAIKPGDPGNSELFLRVSSEDPVRRMPPAAAGHERLAEPEIDLIRRWIEEGAQWQGHWAFIAPRKPEVPSDSYPGWPVNPVDSFVLRRLNHERLEPSPPASRETLIRRLSLDITGTPPELADIDAFLKDESPDAYETVVDRLLSSPRYGERMAIRWLDAARYADTNGYQTDAERDMWRWRDWVIEAFATNKPFDEFTVEQLAGDMLRDASLDQVIATGFNRNHRGNGEGGIVDAEYAVEYVVDRLDTTSTVWLGLTLGCARCHDHKYDPVTQKEYYELFAYFNNVPEKGKAFKYGNSPPFIKAPTPAQAERLAGMDAALASLREQQARLVEQSEDAKHRWERKLAESPADWLDTRDLALSFPEGPEGAAPQERAFAGGDFAELGDQADFGFYDRFSATAWISPEQPDGAIVAKTGNVLPEDDTQGNPGWGFYLKGSKLQVNMINRWLDDCLRLQSREPVAMGRWSHVAFTYDGTRLATGVRVYVDGQPVQLEVIRDEMNQEFKSKEPLRVGRGLGLDYRGRIRGLAVYGRALTPREVSVAAVGRSLDQIAGIRSEDRSAAETRKLGEAFRNTLGPAALTELTARVRDLEGERQRYFDSVPTVMVMQEMTPRKKTYRLDRGAYDAPSEEVLPGLPAALSAANPRGRLGFARWLVSRDNPLTARVTVNRVWQMLWGAGIVKTVEDFGSQGEWPTHPDLLDWLAVDFMDSGWDLKALVKTIAMSAVYRQSSRLRPGLGERDPDNRLLARGPRLRLPAESVRDLSLSVSGLLVDKVGGPSVRPYQPAGLWTELAGGEDYAMGSGADLYRRSLYTFWKRAVPPPSMMLFDSAGREACTVRSVRTNTPLQALNRMNDTAYMQTSKALAARALNAAGDDRDDRLTYIFRLATARRPTVDEGRVLASGFDYHFDRFRNDPESAAAFLGSDRPTLAVNVPEPEIAAYAMVASLVLNLDETITRE
jgi:hypothetical protein